MHALLTARPSQIFCYMTSWSQKRPSLGKFTPDNIDSSLCTHVIYAFGTLKDNRLTIGEDADEAENYAKIVALKEKNPKLKVPTYLMMEMSDNEVSLLTTFNFSCFFRFF